MDAHNVRSEVERIAQDLYERGDLQISGGSRAVVGHAAPVCDPSGNFHSWVVPMTIDEKLVAWAQFSSQLVLQRFSLFLRQEGDLERCPSEADWFDPDVVRRRIIGKLGAEVHLSAPILTFDRDPSRLVWLAETRDNSGLRKRWFVAGQSVWEDLGEQEVTGGSGT